ncbi:hypothetical protein DPMN_150369 [Dreissena polymorpha]|uniref:CCHC-type domain-containing protein n=1 Tax=Dreissena polymorpha TaxID=45954 RepID=A0A9D4FGB5_DREPO|nr:hypothetical protein DPMN_150369 [Dreissena polymorpha]
MIKKKLPPEVLLQLELLKGADIKWSVAKLGELLRQYITAREHTEKSLKDNKESVASKMYRENQRDAVYSKTNLYPNKMESNRTSNKPAKALAAAPIVAKKCRFCARAHWSDECQKYKTTEERKACLKKSCFKCLKEGHLSHECMSINKKCVHCGSLIIITGLYVPINFNKEKRQVENVSYCQKKLMKPKKNTSKKMKVLS